MAFATVQSWDETPASNTEIDGVNIDEGCNPSGINNAIRELMAQVAAWTGDDTIASATTTDLSTVNGQYVNVTGTTTITGFGTVKAGWLKFLRFSGALTLTHNATSLILPGGANITTAGGDTALFASMGSGNWRCMAYQPAAGYPSLSAANTWTATQTFAGIATSGNIVKSTNNSNVVISGGDTAANGANLELYGGTHATQANNAFLDADTITLRSQAGSTRATLDSSTLTLTLPLRLPAGSAAAPSIATTDVDTGLYSVSDGTLGVACDGVQRVHFNSAGLTAGAIGSTFGVDEASTMGFGGTISATKSANNAIRASRTTSDGRVINTYRGTTLVGGATVNATSTSWDTSSDERIKSFIGHYDPQEAIRIIRADPVRDWNWIESYGGGYDIGWGAQTSYSISTNLATPGNDKQPGEDGFEPWGLDKGKRTPYLWAALTWALDKIDELEARLNANGL